jgi:hypothetical protein
VVFVGAGASQLGVYATLGGTLTRIADLTTAIPGGGGALFKAFPAGPSLSGANVAFGGTGTSLGVSTGVYVNFPPAPIAPVAGQHDAGSQRLWQFSGVRQYFD